MEIKIFKHFLFFNLSKKSEKIRSAEVIIYSDKVEFCLEKFASKMLPRKFCLENVASKWKFKIIKSVQTSDYEHSITMSSTRSGEVASEAQPGVKPRNAALQTWRGSCSAVSTSTLAIKYSCLLKNECLNMAGKLFPSIHAHTQLYTRLTLLTQIANLLLVS